MTLIEQIKKAQVSARVARNADAASTLTTLIGEAEMVGKNKGNRSPTDEEVVAVAAKFVKNIDETVSILSLQNSSESRQRITALTAEKVLIEQFLPKQLSEDQLRHVISSIKAEISATQKDMGKVMGLLKSRFAGQYDGAMASKITKEVLS